MVILSPSRSLGVAFLVSDDEMNITGRFFRDDVGVVLEIREKKPTLKIAMGSGEIGWGFDYDFSGT